MRRVSALLIALMAVGCAGPKYALFIEEDSVEAREHESLVLTVRVADERRLPNDVAVTMPDFLSLESVQDVLGGMSVPTASGFLAEEFNTSGGQRVRFRCDRAGGPSTVSMETVKENEEDISRDSAQVRCKGPIPEPSVEVFVAEVFQGTPSGEGFVAGADAGYVINYVQVDEATREQHEVHNEHCVVYSGVENYTSDPAPTVEFTTASASIRMNIEGGKAVYEGLPTESPFVRGRFADVTVRPDEPDSVKTVVQAPEMRNVKVTLHRDGEYSTIEVEIPEDADAADVLRVVASRSTDEGYQGIDCRRRVNGQHVQVIQLGRRPAAFGDSDFDVQILVGVIAEGGVLDKATGEVIPVRTGALISYDERLFNGSGSVR